VIAGNRIVCDEDVHGSAAAVLRDCGHDAVSVPESIGKGASDSAVIAYAARTDRTILTHDEDYLHPSLRRDVRVLYVPDGAAGPGTIADRLDDQCELVPDQLDLSPVTYLSG
jgi:uncharacterized protein with PIN domain